MPRLANSSVFASHSDPWTAIPFPNINQPLGLRLARIQQPSESYVENLLNLINNH